MQATSTRRGALRSLCCAVTQLVLLTTIAAAGSFVSPPSYDASPAAVWPAAAAVLAMRLTTSTAENNMPSTVSTACDAAVTRALEPFGAHVFVTAAQVTGSDGEYVCSVSFNGTASSVVEALCALHLTNTTAALRAALNASAMSLSEAALVQDDPINATTSSPSVIPALPASFHPEATVVRVSTPSSNAGLALMVASPLLCLSALLLGAAAVKRNRAEDEARRHEDLVVASAASAAAAPSIDTTATTGTDQQHAAAMQSSQLPPSRVTDSPPPLLSSASEGTKLLPHGPPPSLPCGRPVRVRSAHSGLYLTVFSCRLKEAKGGIECITDADLAALDIDETCGKWSTASAAGAFLRPRLGEPYVFDADAPVKLGGAALQVFHCRVVDGVVMLRALVTSEQGNKVALDLNAFQAAGVWFNTEVLAAPDADSRDHNASPDAHRPPEDRDEDAVHKREPLDNWLRFRCASADMHTDTDDESTTPGGGGAVEVTLQEAGEGNYLDIARASTDVGARAVLFAGTGAASQRWLLEPVPLVAAAIPAERPFLDSTDQGACWCHRGVVLPLDERVPALTAWTAVTVDVGNGDRDRARLCTVESDDTVKPRPVRVRAPDDGDRGQVFRVTDVDAETSTFTLVSDAELLSVRVTDTGLRLGAGRDASYTSLAAYAARFAVDRRTGELLWRPWHYTRDPVTFARLWAVPPASASSGAFDILPRHPVDTTVATPLTASLPTVDQPWCWRATSPVEQALRVRGCYWIVAPGTTDVDPSMYSARDGWLCGATEESPSCSFAEGTRFRISPVVDPYGDDPAAGAADDERLHVIVDASTGLALTATATDCRPRPLQPGDRTQLFRFIRLRGRPAHEVLVTCAAATAHGTSAALELPWANGAIRPASFDPLNPLLRVELHDTRFDPFRGDELPAGPLDTFALRWRPPPPADAAATKAVVGHFRDLHLHGEQSSDTLAAATWRLERVQDSGNTKVYRVHCVPAEGELPSSDGATVLSVERVTPGAPADVVAVPLPGSPPPDETPDCAADRCRSNFFTILPVEPENRNQLFVIDGMAGELHLRSVALDDETGARLMDVTVRFVAADPAHLEQAAAEGAGPPVVVPAAPVPILDADRLEENAAIAAAAAAGRPARVLRTMAPFALSALFAVLFLAGVAFFVDFTGDSSVPWAVGFAFRTELCNASALAPLPAASVAVPADGKCRRAEGRGLTTPLWAAARCLSAAAAEVKAAPSQSSCETAVASPVVQSTCTADVLRLPYLPFAVVQCAAEEDARAALGLDASFSTARRTLVPAIGATGADVALRASAMQHTDEDRTAAVVRTASLARDGPRGSALLRGSVLGTAADVGAESRLTVSAWVTLTPAASGFVVITGNQWLSASDGTERVAERLLQFIAGGRAPLQAPFGAFFALHVDGPTRTVTAAHAAAADTSPELLRWNVDALEGQTPASGTPAAQLFDGRPHLLTVRSASRKYSGRYELLVDAATSQQEPYWQLCGAGFPAAAEPLPSQVAIPPAWAAASSVQRDPGMLVAYASSDAANFTVGDVHFAQRIETLRDVAYTAGVDLDASVSRGASIAVAVIMCLVFTIGAVLIGVEERSVTMMSANALRGALKNADGRSASQGESSAAPAGDPHKAGAAASKSAARIEFKKPPPPAGGSNAGVPSAPPPGGQAHAVLLDALTMTQTLDIYFTGWAWPATFEVPMSFVILLPALDLSLDFFSLPALLTPLLQLVAAVAFLIVGLRILAADNERFAARAPAMAREAREGSSLSDDVTAIPTPSTTFPLHDLYTITVPSSVAPAARAADGGDSVALGHDDVVVLAAGLQLLLEPDAESAQMLASGTLARTFAPSGSGRVLPLRGALAGRELTFDAGQRQVRCPRADGEPAGGGGGPAVTVAFNPIRFCPDHPDARLIRALDEPHKRLIEECQSSGRDSPYLCVHRGAPFRELRQKACDVDSGFFVCPECTFTVCYNCAALKLADKAKAFAATKRYEWRDSSLLLGLVVVAAIEAVYVPLLKSAIMVIACHRDVQCTFPGCYRDPTAAFGVAVGLACAVVGLVGLGVPAIIFKLLVDRKRVLLHHVFGDPDAASGSLWSVLSYRCDDADWGHVLKYDRSVLKGIYATFELRYMCTQPLLLLGKLALVAGVLASAPESLAQLLTASGVQTTLLLVYVLGQPFIDDQIDRLSKVGSMYQVALLALMAVYRTERNVALPIVMLVGSALYTAFLAFIIFRVVQSIRHGRLMARVALGPFVAVRQLDEPVLKHLAANAPSELYERTDHLGRTAVAVAAGLPDAAGAAKMIQVLRELAPARAADDDDPPPATSARLDRAAARCFTQTPPTGDGGGTSALAAMCKRVELRDEVVAVIALLEPSQIAEAGAAEAASEAGITATLAVVLAAIGPEAALALARPMLLAAVKGASPAGVDYLFGSGCFEDRAAPLDALLGTFELWDAAVEHFSRDTFDTLIRHRTRALIDHGVGAADAIVWVLEADGEKEAARASILEHVFRNDDVAALDYFADMKPPLGGWLEMKLGQAFDGSFLELAVLHKSFGALRRAVERSEEWRKAVADGALVSDYVVKYDTRDDVDRVDFALQLDHRCSRVSDPPAASNRHLFGGCSVELHLEEVTQYETAPPTAHAHVDLPVELANRIVAVHVQGMWHDSGSEGYDRTGTIRTRHLVPNWADEPAPHRGEATSEIRVLRILPRDVGGAIADVRAELADDAADTSACHANPDRLRLFSDAGTGTGVPLSAHVRLTFLTAEGLAAIIGSADPADWSHQAYFEQLEQHRHRCPLMSEAVLRRLRRLHGVTTPAGQGDDSEDEEGEEGEEGTGVSWETRCDRLANRDKRRTWWLDATDLPEGVAALLSDAAHARALVRSLSARASPEQLSSMLPRTPERVAFMRAVYTGDVDAARRYLAEHPEEINAPVAPCGQVPMHWARVTKVDAMLKLLKYLEAAETAVDIFGFAASDAAIIAAEDLDLRDGVKQEDSSTRQVVSAREARAEVEHVSVQCDDGPDVVVDRAAQFAAANPLAGEILAHGATSSSAPGAAVSIPASDQQRLALWVASHRSMCVAAVAAHDWSGLPAVVTRTMGLQAIDGGWYAGVIAAVAALIVPDPMSAASVDFGTRLWHAAVLAGRVAMAQLLLELRVPFHRQSRATEDTGAMLAHFLPGPAIHRFISGAGLPTGSLASQRDGASWQPIHHAARRGDTRTIAWLVADHGADLDARTANGESIEHIAVRFGHLPVLRLYQATYPSAKDHRGYAVLHNVAIRHVHTLLAELSDDVADTALWEAATSDRRLPAFAHPADEWLVFFPAMQRSLARQDAAGRTDRCGRLWRDSQARASFVRLLCSTDPAHRAATEWLASTLKMLHWPAQSRHGARVWWMLYDGSYKIKEYLQTFTVEAMPKQLATGRAAFFEHGVAVAGLRAPEDGQRVVNDDEKEAWERAAQEEQDQKADIDHDASEVGPTPRPRLQDVLGLCATNECTVGFVASVIHHFDVNFDGGYPDYLPIRGLFYSQLACGTELMDLLHANGARVDLPDSEGVPAFVHLLLYPNETLGPALLRYVTADMIPADLFTKSFSHDGDLLIHRGAISSPPQHVLCWMRDHGADVCARTRPPAADGDADASSSSSWDARAKTIFDCNVTYTHEAENIAFAASLLGARFVNDVEHGVTVAHLLPQYCTSFDSPEAFEAALKGVPDMAEALAMRTTDSGELPVAAFFRGGKGNRGHVEGCLMAMARMMPAELLRQPAVESSAEMKKLRPRDQFERKKLEKDDKRVWPFSGSGEDGPAAAVASSGGLTLFDLLPRFGACFPALAQHLLDRGVRPMQPDTARALVHLFSHHAALRDAIRSRFEGGEDIPDDDDGLSPGDGDCYDDDDGAGKVPVWQRKEKERQRRAAKDSD